MDKSLIQITNFMPHPTQKEWVIFLFHKEATADMFESLLKKEDIKYERDLDEDATPPQILFGVPRVRSKKAIELNYFAHGKNRKPSISSPVLRWTLLLLVAGMVGIAIYAYITSE